MNKELDDETKLRIGKNIFFSFTRRPKKNSVWITIGQFSWNILSSYVCLNKSFFVTDIEWNKSGNNFPLKIHHPFSVSVYLFCTSIYWFHTLPISSRAHRNTSGAIYGLVPDMLQANPSLGSLVAMLKSVRCAWPVK